jgi:5-carboxymethyl-2-hydroxymuconate isomerase
VAVLAGRPEELRVRIADAMFEALKAAFAQSAASGEVNLTLEVREMARGTYRK